MTFLKPICTLQLIQCLQRGLCTYTMRAMRVCQVTGQIYLMRFHFIEKLHDDVNVLLRPLSFLDSSCLIERKVQEVGIGLIIETEGAYTESDRKSVV